MSDYTNHLLITPDGAFWRLEQILVWEIGKKGSNLKVIIPVGFNSDLATIPWFARWLFKTSNAKYAKAAILHDYMLLNEFSPITAAAEFAQALKADGVSNWRAIIMGLAVLSRS